MRSYFVLALFSFLVALVYATPTPYDYVFLSNIAYKDSYKVYYKLKPVCVNVDKAFSGRSTFVITRGRSVELFAGANCTNLVRTSRANNGDYGFWQPLMSFKVGKK